MKHISVIIPTFNRVGLLHQHLKELCKQTLSPMYWEVIVVNDGGPDPRDGFDWKSLPYSINFLEQKNAGPASARNLGAKYAKNDILLFVGDDCIPGKNLLYYHFLRHNLSKEPIAIQGFTDWHPHIPPDDFHAFLNNGLQANWNALRTPDGKWIGEDKEIPGWLLTTNVSMDKSEFWRIGGFDERFKFAAYEDIALAMSGASMGMKTYFCPNAMNFHFHRQTLEGFVNRQIIEGRSRIWLCLNRPEMAQTMLPPADIRGTSSDMLWQAVDMARALHYNQDPTVQEQRYRRWAETFQLASLEGIRRGIKEHGGVWRAIPHMHTGDQCMNIALAAGALERGDPDYAIFAMEWCNRDGRDNWAAQCAYAEVLISMKDYAQAKQYAQKAMELGVGEAWPKELMEKINGVSAH